MGIVSTILIGLIVGLVARMLKPGDDNLGWIMTILLGIGGAMVATYGAPPPCWIWYCLARSCC